jgi:hypothetical protein
MVNNSEHPSAKPFKQKQLLKQAETGTAGFGQQREPASEQKYRQKTPTIKVCTFSAQSLYMGSTISLHARTIPHNS